GILVGCADREVLAGPARNYDAEGIGGWSGFGGDEARGRTFLSGDLVFVGPAAVVGHGFAAENLRVELAGLRVHNRRVVDQHDHGLAPNIDALVVIPTKLRRDDAVAHKYHIGFL